MSSNVDTDVYPFLNQFFGEGNQLDLDKIEHNVDNAGVLLPWVQRLTGSDPLSTVLPRRNVHNPSNIIWYGIARSDQQLRSLGEELTAFVGPTWSTFRGQRATLDLTDPVDLAVHEFTQGRAFKFIGNNGKIWESLERLRGVWEQRSGRILEIPRPTGRVLHDFFMALRAGNRESAEKELQYLHDQHRFDAINLLFLRIQLLAELGYWGELLQLPDLPSVLQMRRPPAVTQALISAVYHQELIQFENNNDPAGAIRHFREVVLPRFGGFFSTRAGSKSPDVVKSFMLLAIAGIPPDPVLRDELLAVPGFSEHDDIYLQKLAALLPTAPPTSVVADPLQQAQEALLAADYDRALNLALEIPNSVPRVRLLLECAYELQTLEAARAALTAYEALQADDQEFLYAVRINRKFIDYLGSETGKEPSPKEVDVVPDNWILWATRVQSEPSWPRAVEVARRGAEEWEATELLRQPEGVKQLTLLISSCLSSAESTLHDALPYLLRTFQKDDQWPRRECMEIYASLLDVLALTTNGGGDDLSIFNDLIDALLELGIEKKKYEEILGYAEDLWERFASPSTVDWILEFLDYLVQHPCPSEGHRATLLSKVVNKLPLFARRIEANQWLFFDFLVKDFHKEEDLKALLDEYAAQSESLEGGRGDLLERLNGKTVAIYTLTEAVARRVKQILEASCADVRVQLSHDKVGSSRLRQLARESDLFVIATASATHAATDFIEAQRKNLPILRPVGKGSASMIRALRSYLNSLDLS
jgi:hypothetical protein